MNVLENKPAVIRVDLIEKGEYITLNSTQGDTVMYSLLDSAGNYVNGIADEIYSFEGEISSLELSFDENCNTISGEKDIETRFIIVVYTKDNKQTTKRIPYKVIKFIPYTVSETDVFDAIGVSSTILNEDSVDIYSNYLLLKAELGEKFVNAIYADDDSTVKANRALLLKTAISIENSIPLGVPKIESDNVVSETRFTFTMEELKSLFDDMRNELKDLIDELAEKTYDAGAAVFVVANYADPFTGEE